MSATTTTTAPIVVDVVSDGICPFCYIGKRKLDMAVAQYNASRPNEPAFVVETRWHPFDLNPLLTAEAIPKAQMYEDLFGPSYRLKWARTDAVAASVGITIKNDGLVGSTFDYHRLMTHVLDTRGADVQNKLAEALFVEFFENGRPLSDHAVLADGAEQAGLDRAQVLEFLASGELAYETRITLDESCRSGISGVPDFSIAGGKFRIHGAEGPAAWIRVFEQIRAERLASEPKTAGKEAADAVEAGIACSLEDGTC
ncbi:hypothetical protein H9P43_006158 [Blastocladiella emersonii ATCC 22665]|nr:hypothetical protein H9P43_006151 [Blastocladiella emersonii ATCC 22665]KAI9175794.1 hypothetical protein H9P43_006158 [Blastocladiella emersonii ATCC 22665]